MLKWLRRLVLTGLILGLVASNILTLTHAAFNSALSGLVGSALGVKTVSNALQGRIARQQATIGKQQAQTLKRQSAARQFGKRLTHRTRRVAAKSIAAIPAESLPVIGIGVLIADTGYELYAACETMNDLDRLYTDLGMQEDIPEDALRAVCDPKLPEPRAIWDTLLGGASQIESDTGP